VGELSAARLRIASLLSRDGTRQRAAERTADRQSRERSLGVEK
jgi:hypothetical protein